MTSPDDHRAGHRRALAYIHLATLLAGVTGLFGKWVTAGPAVITGGRTFVAFVVLFAFARFRGIPLKIGDRKRRHATLLSGVLLAAHWWTFFHAIEVSSVSIALLALASYPMITALIEPVFFREKYRRADLLATATVVAGLALVAPSSGPGQGAESAGLLWGVASGSLFACVSLVTRASVEGRHPMAVAAHQQFAAMLVTLPFAVVAPGAFAPKTLLLVTAMGIVFTAGLQTLFVASLRHLSVRTASVVLMLEPVYGIAFARVFLGEHPTARMLAGGALICGAAVAVTWRRSPAKPENRPAV